jgi:hypothetical protein
LILIESQSSLCHANQLQSPMCSGVGFVLSEGMQNILASAGPDVVLRAPQMLSDDEDFDEAVEEEEEEDEEETEDEPQAKGFRLRAPSVFQVGKGSQRVSGTLGSRAKCRVMRSGALTTLTLTGAGFMTLM